MSFCTRCGTQLKNGASFCTSCGTKLDVPAHTSQAVASSQTAEPDLTNVRLQLHAVEPAKPSGSGKLFLWIGGVLLLLTAAGIAVTVYVGHRVKERISAELRSRTDPADKPSDKSKDKSGGDPEDVLKSLAQAGKLPDGHQNDGDDPNLAQGLNAIGGLMDKMGFGDPPPNPYQELPIVKSDTMYKNLCDPKNEATDVSNSSVPAVGTSGIPMEKGLLVVRAWGRKFGDSESMNTVSRITNKYVEVADSGTYFANADAEKGSPGSAVRDVCASDLQNAHGLSTGFESNGPTTLPGTTTINVSLELFRTLKETGKIDFRYLEYFPADLPDGEGYLHWDRGILTRVEPGDISLPVIVNGSPTTLPAIHAAGTILVESKKAQELSKDPTDRPLATELYVLDDPVNPLVLLYKLNINNFRVQVTEIRFPSPKPEAKIEQDLSKNKKALIYGIYFDYNSAEIKKESEPVLKEIAQAMEDKPDWKLTIVGNTDNIGGHKYNLDLSQRRSASVKKALVERYHVDPNRLSTSGNGDSDPIDTNDTLEGRARNRRVELTLD
jgi:outer membrane protein OmpA-like peptidoglycan-associated protein